MYWKTEYCSQWVFADMFQNILKKIMKYITADENFMSQRKMLNAKLYITMENKINTNNF